MQYNLMIIESPGKKAKLAQILKELHPDQSWRIEATVGHIRDLPSKGQAEDEITTGVKKDFTPVYELTERGKAVAKKLKAACNDAAAIYLATDPDREGESIAWHVQSALKLKNPIRVSFDEITQQRVQAALASPGRINGNLVAAQEARRVLDRLVGYLVSSELRRQTGAPLSAGRVQSPAVRLVVDRERLIRQFKATTHYGARLAFAGDAGSWQALWQVVPAFASEDEPYFMDRGFAALVAACGQVEIASYEETDAKRSPPAPFTTSTLQQAASNALKMSPKETMATAQALYEQGIITYHRSDNPNVTDEAMPKIRETLTGLGYECVASRRTFKGKSGAQEGHPAITPTGWGVVDAGANPQQQALYGLIRLRALASQMPVSIHAVRSARLTGAVDGKPVEFTGKGRTLKQPGWLALMAGDQADENEKEESTNPIPVLIPGEKLSPTSGEVIEQTTKAPPRYTQASLIRALESEGIGRPSTYAAILENIEKRGYIEEKVRFLYPTPTGEQVITALVGHFAFANLDYTAEMENELDAVALGTGKARDVIGKLVASLERELGAVSSAIPAPLASEHTCPECNKGLNRRKGSNGWFWGCSGYPECKTTLPDAGGKPGERKAHAVSEAHNCRDCQKPLIHRIKDGKKGFDFWGCSGYPECKTTYKNDSGKPVYPAA